MSCRKFSRCFLANMVFAHYLAPLCINEFRMSVQLLSKSFSLIIANLLSIHKSGLCITTVTNENARKRPFRTPQITFFFEAFSENRLHDITIICNHISKHLILFTTRKYQVFHVFKRLKLKCILKDFLHIALRTTFPESLTNLQNGETCVSSIVTTLEKPSALLFLLHLCCRTPTTVTKASVLFARSRFTMSKSMWWPFTKVRREARCRLRAKFAPTAF